ncbi:MAG: HEAT repeat domain-containing protein [Candidatus Hydrogenedentes bacterium]|nr:HEAT repeat domain-containing protein [Candidatus Hydrogenedentota bacterium]
MYRTYHRIHTSAASSLVHLAVLVLTAFLCVAVSASEVAQLVADLGGPDGQARIRARQLLPRYGEAAVEGLLPLLASGDFAVKRTAFNVLADIANGLVAKDQETVSATESDRARFVKQVSALLAVDQAAEMKLEALKLLPIVFQDTDDFSPIVALLSDPSLREKARETLEQIGTHGACRQLLTATADPTVDPEFVVALIRSVGRLRQNESALRLLGLTTHSNPRVRVAAAQSLAWMGHPDLYPSLKSVVQNATPDTQAEAFDAVYRYAASLVQSGGNWDLAMRIYGEMLAAAPTSPLKSAALMGLGIYGDSTSVPVIVGALNGADATLVDAAAMALGSVQGREAVRAVKTAFPSLSPSAQEGLVAIWGQRKEKEALDLITGFLKSNEPHMRISAIRAIANIGSGEAFPALMEIAKSGSEDERALALKTAVSIANSMDKVGNPAEAGKAYLSLYEMAPDDDVRRTALKGISEAPLPEAFDVAKASIDKPELKDVGAIALAGIAGALAKAGDAAKSNEAMELLRAVQVAPETLVELAKRLQAAGVPADLSNMLGVVKVWQIVGPFDWKTDQDWDTAFVGEPKIDLAASLSAGNNTVQWKKVVTADPVGLVDLAGNLGQRDRCFGYAYAVVEVPEAIDAQVRLGSDDGNKVWINGTVVCENRVDRGAALDQDKANIHLNKGRNEILVKISQGGGGWCFCLRLATENGAGLVFTQPE